MVNRSRSRFRSRPLRLPTMVPMFFSAYMNTLRKMYDSYAVIADVAKVEPLDDALSALLHP